MHNEFNNSGRGDVLESGAAHPKPTLTVDVEKCQSYLDGLGMTDAEKTEFLQALWSIIVSFVELGFGVHPLQEVCGKTQRSKVRVPKRPSLGYLQNNPRTTKTPMDSAPKGRLEDL